jgi:hypothetical protein
MNHTNRICTLCVRNIEGKCELSKVDMYEFRKTPIKYGGCNDGLKFLAREREEREPVEREAYSWA